MTTDVPADVMAERGLLGSLLIDGAALEEVAGIVAAEDFTRPVGQLVYAAMLRLRDRGVPVDIVTLCGALEDGGHLAAIGEANVTALINDAPTSLHALAYARRVAETARMRRGEPGVLPEPEPEAPRRRLSDRLGLDEDEADQETW